MKDIIHSAIFALLVVLSGGHSQMLQSITNAKTAASGPNCSLCAVRQAVTSNGGGTTTHPESFTASTTAGDAIIIFQPHTNWTGSGTSTISSVEGDTWYPCNSTVAGASFTDLQFNTTWGMSCFYAVNIPGGSTDTITIVPTDCASNCTSIGNAIIELSGVATTVATAYDGWGHHENATATTGTNNTTCGSVTTTQTNDYVICGMDQSIGTASVGTSPVNFGSLILSGSTNAAVEGVVWSSSGAINPTMTDSSTTDKYIGITVAFK